MSAPWPAQPSKDVSQERLLRDEPRDLIVLSGTSGIGALQPVADDTAYGRRCPIPAVRNTRRDRREHTLEREAHKMRIVLLAEMILNLQDVPGFDACVGQMLNRDLIESTYAELEIARRLYNGVP
jgi:hypothetical protein